MNIERAKALKYGDTVKFRALDNGHEVGLKDCAFVVVQTASEELESLSGPYVLISCITFSDKLYYKRHLDDFGRPIKVQVHLFPSTRLS